MKPPKPLFASGDAIKLFRKKHGLTQFDFWARIGVTQSGGSRYETGRDIPEPVQRLLTITYGTESQSQRLVTALRGWKT